MTLPPCLTLVLIKTRLSPRAVSILFASCVSASGPTRSPHAHTHPLPSRSHTLPLAILQVVFCSSLGAGLGYDRSAFYGDNRTIPFISETINDSPQRWVAGPFFTVRFPPPPKNDAVLPPRNTRHRSRFWWGGTRWTTAPASRGRRWSARLQPTRKPAPTTTAAARRAPAAFLDALTVAPGFILSVRQLQSLCSVSPCWRTRQHPSFSIFL